MLKLLLSSAFLLPVIATPLLAHSLSQDDQNQAVNYTRLSFQEAFVDPEIQKLAKCESAEFDVFFYDQYVESHSAEHLEAGIEMAAGCKNISYVIEPITAGRVGVADKDLITAQTQELSLILAAYGIDAKVNKIHIQEDTGNLLLNGRNATLKIVISDQNLAS